MARRSGLIIARQRGCSRGHRTSFIDNDHDDPATLAQSADTSVTLVGFETADRFDILRMLVKRSTVAGDISGS